jgi:thiamine-phosphate pyrophosphorylase
LLDLIQRAVAAGVDLIQIRERDLSTNQLLPLAEAACRSAAGSETRILINDRADVAASVEAGVHLTTRSLLPDVVRRAFGPHLLIGVSTHSLSEVQTAASGGADFVVFGPIFETESKKRYGPPVGLQALREVTSRGQLPVLALGGIAESNLNAALNAGAAGIAGISLFAEADDLKTLVGKIRAGAGHI